MTSFTNIESLKANCELVFSHDLSTEAVYPILLESDCPSFVENEEQLYIDEHGTYVTGTGVDYTRAAVTEKNADSFVIEAPMISLYNPAGEIYRYNMIKQNGNWVLDDHYCFERDV